MMKRKHKVQRMTNAKQGESVGKEYHLLFFRRDYNLLAKEVYPDIVWGVSSNVLFP